MFWCLVRLSTGALCGGLYANPLEMAIQSAVACSEAKDDGLLVSRQLMERVLVWVVSFSLTVTSGTTVRVVVLADSSLMNGPPCWPSGKASASRAKDPGFESLLRRDFFGVDLKIGTPVATLPGA